MKVLCHHGNKSTILLFNSIFRTTLEVSSKLSFVEISYVPEKLWLFNHRRAVFLASKFWNIFHFSASLKLAKLLISTWSKRENLSSDNRPHILQSSSTYPFLISLFIILRRSSYQSGNRPSACYGVGLGKTYDRKETFSYPCHILIFILSILVISILISYI